jgi:hypothetical protein
MRWRNRTRVEAGRMRATELLVATLVLILAGAASGEEAKAMPGPPGKDITVYFIGNSLTRNIPLERLQELFKTQGGRLDYGMQLGGGHRLELHLSMRNHGNKPGEGTYNLNKPYGKWDEAFSKHKFDAIVLQPYMEELDQEVKILKRRPWFTAGSLQAASAFIDYATAQTKPGKGRYDLEHSNTENVATERFYIYATWPGAEAILKQDGQKTYAAYYAREYRGGAQPCTDFFSKLVKGLNKAHPELKVPVRLIPAGEVLAVLDQRIREGTLPGIEAFYERNQKYYIKSRRNDKRKSPFDPETFQREAGVLNFYADGVHMNDQPHNGADSGTIGSYTAALTVYATLTGESPAGVGPGPYEMFDAEKDAALIRALQETVWSVVTGNPHTGVRGEDR